MDEKSPHPLRWASVGAIENEHLSDLLSLASTNYSRQIDWFLRHHNTALKNLATILAAESALVGLAATQETIPAAFLFALLLFLSFIGPMLAWLATQSCERGFTAAMESAFMMTKLAWAMGATSQVAVNKEVVGNAKCPGCDDYTLFAPRWVKDALDHKTCAGFVNANLGNRENTLFLTKLTIIVFGASAAVLGLLGAGLLLIYRT